MVPMSRSTYGLPRAPGSGQDLLDAEVRHALVEGRAVDVISVAQQVARRVGVRKRLDHLLRRPLRRGVGRDMEVKDPAAIVRG
jgi:hypothetical protein